MTRARRVSAKVTSGGLSSLFGFPPSAHGQHSNESHLRRSLWPLGRASFLSPGRDETAKTMSDVTKLTSKLPYPSSDPTGQHEATHWRTVSLLSDSAALMVHKKVKLKERSSSSFWQCSLRTNCACRAKNKDRGEDLRMSGAASHSRALHQ